MLQVKPEVQNCGRVHDCNSRSCRSGWRNTGKAPYGKPSEYRPTLNLAVDQWVSTYSPQATFSPISTELWSMSHPQGHTEETEIMAVQSPCLLSHQCGSVFTRALQRSSSAAVALYMKTSPKTKTLLQRYLLVFRQTEKASFYS
ncbi:hypothetical protein UY3_07447 [Chelonia mydas]|uniref:Uncharacterized protein n=1 Tax=Chelonia mydas TaxID=8469 RepID=M7BTR6_CHEMY|nr:hypothetical protein UY3_07447 [Chelonia mydas]